jgi:HSP20 family protein
MSTTDDKRDVSLDELRTTPGEDDSLPVDVERHGDSYVVSALLPGLRTQDLDVTVHGRQVRIAAALPDRRRKLLPNKRRQVSRVVRLPEQIDHKTAEATYHDDLLRVTVETWQR